MRERARVAGTGRDRSGYIGFMGSPATGFRTWGATSKMRCVDAAALFAAAILRRNPDSIVIPFDTAAYEAKVDPGDTILSLAERLARYGGGGTHGSIPLNEANTKYGKRRFAGCVLVSDNQSWVGAGRYGSTGVMTEWHTFRRQPAAVGRQLAQAGFHRHPALRIDIGSRAN